MINVNVAAKFKGNQCKILFSNLFSVVWAGWKLLFVCLFSCGSMTKPSSGTRFLKVPIINGPRDLLSVEIQDEGFKSFADFLNNYWMSFL